MIDVLKQASLLTIQEYIHKRKTNLVYIVQNCPIFKTAQQIKQLHSGDHMCWGHDMIL
jgi:hypothetical protein